MPRTIKSMFVEVVSFLTLFALIGTMTSNFWERYLIQTELSNMKSSLHVLKETVFSIEAAYDNLHDELRDLVDINDVKSAKSTPKEFTLSQHKNTYDLNTFSNFVVKEITKLKSDKSVGNAAIKTENVRPRKENFKAVLKNATTVTRNPLKSTGISAEPDHRVKIPTTNNNKEIFMGNDEYKCCKKDACCNYQFDFRKF